MRLWTNSKEAPEGKFLVVRRDGSVPSWPHFVMGARDPAVPAALRVYAERAKTFGFDSHFADDVKNLAEEFEDYRMEFGQGDPDASPHRRDDPAVIRVMRGIDGKIRCWRARGPFGHIVEHEFEDVPGTPAAPPVALILHCPECGKRHIDENEWATRPHHTHACQFCGLTWRSAVVNTVGVRFLPGFFMPPNTSR